MDTLKKKTTTKQQHTKTKQNKDVFLYNAYDFKNANANKY